MHDKKVKLRHDAAKQACERFKERRNPSADAHKKPMNEGAPLAIVPSWARAIRYRPSLVHCLSLTLWSCTIRAKIQRNQLAGAGAGVLDTVHENDFSERRWTKSGLPGRGATRSATGRCASPKSDRSVNNNKVSATMIMRIFSIIVAVFALVAGLVCVSIVSKFRVISPSDSAC